MNDQPKKRGRPPRQGKKFAETPERDIAELKKKVSDLERQLERLKNILLKEGVLKYL